jgi:hypothetical protein
MTESIVMAFIYLRRSIRQRQAILNRATATRTTLLRLARKLDAGSPFDQARAAIYRARHAAMDTLWHAELHHRRELGRELLAMAPQFDAATNFEQRLELLNVNVADRADIRPGAGLSLLIAGHYVEDSAARRGEHHQSGTLYAAVQLEIIVTLTSTPEGRAAADKVMVDLFGQLGVKPTLQLVSASTTSTTTKGI